MNLDLHDARHLVRSVVASVGPPLALNDVFIKDRRTHVGSADAMALEIYFAGIATYRLLNIAITISTTAYFYSTTSTTWPNCFLTW
jgi:hypothetical protein